MEKIIYIADLDQDIDDIIAIEYLHKNNVLQCVVLDPYPIETIGFQRISILKDMGIDVLKKMPSKAKYVFVGGALTLISNFIYNHKIDYLIMNGGFVGNNLMTNPLKKFKNKKECRTYNFNCDVQAVDKVLKSNNIENIMLVGKNVCHNKLNTPSGIWKNEQELFNKYNINDTKLQHDLLACREGLVELGFLNEEPFLEYQFIQPYNLGLNGNKTLWGSEKPNNKNQYQIVKAAINWKE